MKLALLYTVWTGDDMEMLQKSIKQHLPHVDGILLFTQQTSNKGNDGGEFEAYVVLPISDAVRWVVRPFFEPDLSKNTKENERVKHNMMIQEAKRQGFTHFVLCACDHFYEPDQFEYAKSYHLANEVDVSFTIMRTYYKNENWFLDPMEEYYMPFIHKMYPHTQITSIIKYPIIVDPSVKVNTCQQWIIFDPKEVLLHHYSMVRKDIEKKLRNAAASIRWTPKQVETFIQEYENAKPGDSISYFQGRKIVEVR